MLFRWLDEHPGTSLPAVKEPHYFSHPAQTPGGIAGYRRLFAGCPAGDVTGEASPVYVDPEVADAAARRMAEEVPDARLVMLTRDRARRAASHYRHAVRTGREDRPFALAATPDSEYVRRSLYAAGLAPYLQRFPVEQMLVTSLGSLTDDDRGQAVWEAVLDHLGLSTTTRPDSRHNVGDRLDGVPQPLLRVAARHRFLVARLPRALREAVKSAASFLGRGGTVQTDPAALPEGSVSRLEDDRRRFDRLLDEHGVPVVR